MPLKINYSPLLPGLKLEWPTFTAAIAVSGNERVNTYTVLKLQFSILVIAIKNDGSNIESDLKLNYKYMHIT